MNSLEEQLQRVLESHGLSCGAAISSDGEIVARAGNFQTFGSEGLVSFLLGHSKATIEYLEGQAILPRIWRQGNEIAFVDKAIRSLTLVLFGRVSGDALAQFTLSKAIGATIAETFAQDSA